MPSRYPKFLLISEGMLCFTVLCDLLEHLSLKDKREQQTDVKHNQKGSVCGELVRGSFWFVCSCKQMGIILPCLSSDSSWRLLISIEFVSSYMTTTFVVEAMAAANAQLRWKRMEKRKVCVWFNFPFFVLSRRTCLRFLCIIALPR